MPFSKKNIPLQHKRSFFLCFIQRHFYFYTRKHLSHQHMQHTLSYEGIWVREPRRIRLINFDSITHIECIDGISVLMMGKKTVKKLHLPLSSLEKKFPPSQFFRTHRNYIVNKKYVRDYNQGDPEVLCAGEAKIPIARRRKKEFNTFIKQSTTKPKNNGSIGGSGQ